MKTTCRAGLVALGCAFLTSCPGEQKSPDAILTAENSRLIAENSRLIAENTGLNKKNEDLHGENGRLKTRQGYLVLSTGVAGTTAVALFCVGLAVGIRIRRGISQNEPRT